MTIGVHVCEGCGKIHPTIGLYLDCVESHATNEPDRPRRDVSIEEAERMPMTDEELDDIDDTAGENNQASAYVVIKELVAEVRRLRAEIEHAETVWWIPAPPPEQLEAPSTEWPEGWTEVGATDQTGDTS